MMAIIEVFPCQKYYRLALAIGRAPRDNFSYNFDLNGERIRINELSPPDITYSEHLFHCRLSAWLHDILEWVFGADAYDAQKNAGSEFNKIISDTI